MVGAKKLIMAIIIPVIMYIAPDLIASNSAQAQYPNCAAYYSNQQYIKIFSECIELADNGDAQIQAMIGNLYMMGYGVEENIPKAIEYFKMAANQGHAHSAYALGALYFTGEVIPTDYEEALIWIKIGAIKGSFDAKDLLSAYYLTGLAGVEKNPKLAFLYMKNAADSGRIPSIFKVAKFYETGVGTPIDKAKALALYQKASKAGYKPATDYLASTEGRISLAIEKGNEATPLPPMGVKVQRGVDAINPPPPGFSNEFKILHEKPLSKNEEVIDYLKLNIRSLMAPYIFELSRRLGYQNMDEAIVWFKVAQFRSLVDAYKCTDATARQGILAWPRFAPDVLLAIRENPQREKDAIIKALEIEASFPDNSSPLWICMHGMQAISASIRGEEIKNWHYPKSDWSRIRKETLEKIKQNFNQ